MVELGDGRVRVVDLSAGHPVELLRIHRSDAVRARWGDPEDGWPFDDPDAVPCTVLVDGAVGGYVQYSEENTAMYEHAGIDLFLEESLHGQGIGREVVWLVADHLLGTRGHHRLIIDPAADNTAAIRCYTSVGFRPVGIMRAYERGLDGCWHDGLLMDLLAGELLDPRPGGLTATPNSGR